MSDWNNQNSNRNNPFEDSTGYNRNYNDDIFDLDFLTQNANRNNNGQSHNANHQSNGFANEPNILDNDLLSDPFTDANGVSNMNNFNSHQNAHQASSSRNPFSDNNNLISDDESRYTARYNESIIPDDEDTRSYLQSSSNRIHEAQRQSGIKGLVSNVKTKIGISNPSYSGMEDIPIKDQSDGKSDFDIRRIWDKMRGKKQDDSVNSGPRVIHINDSSSNKAFGYYDNHISTTKYNAATFLPKFFFEQFSKYANLFFLFTSIIQQVPNVTPTNRYTTIGTLTVVLIVSAVKEIMEDLKRAGADKELNSSKVDVLDSATGEFVTKKWINVSVGDVIKVKSEDPFPADLILLSSSEPEGLCYIETANLDGETNLKIKQSRVETSNLVDPREIIRIQGKILSEKPNSSLYTYEGTLTFNGREIPLSPDQLLLRGATLRNTPWIHGIVVFTGHETKLMRNATAAPIKRTDVERIINLQIIALFAILIILSLISSVGNVIKLRINASSIGYLATENTNKTKLFFQDILTYWILFSNLVPISLFVTVEVIKYYQAFMIGSDLDMYYEETDTPTGVRTSSLVEELGQIEYIFSDKTGTLTRNIMEFKSCSIAGRCYIEEIPEDRAARFVDGIEVGYYNFHQLQEHLQTSESAKVIDEFLTLLAACHTVIPEFKPDGSIKYQAASPDEGALVEGAAMLNYKFTIRKPKYVTLEANGTPLNYELLNICEFNSTRKRMSAIFRCPDGLIRLYCKGADTVILERASEENNPFIDTTLRHLEEFAVDGLRTLCIASRIIPEAEYQNWTKIYDEAATSLGNRAEMLDAAAELIEKDLFLLGATAIEDKLQDGVPETIRTLQDAGIKVWVLTGDRQETAINIGMSCKLLSEDMNLLVINEETKEDTRANLEEKLQAINEHQINENEIDTLALIIDGKSLSFALESDLEDMLIEIGTRCKAVICCRVSPLQKALVVKMVKRKKKALLLAIGDGANDVSMIQAAHVGVGISGMEGMQAARSADISIGQFKYLRKLLLVHGAWSYQRISTAILYSFYKNVALYMTQFWYVFANCYSGQSIIESWTLTFYNVIFTVFPPFVLGVFDQFVSARLLDRYPQLYQLGQQRKFFNISIFWGWVANGFYHSAIIYVTSSLIYRYGDELSGGLIADHWTWGTAVYTVCTLTALGKAALVSSLWTKFTLIAVPGSFAVWIIFFPAYATIAPLVNVSNEYVGVLSKTYPSIVYWAMIFSIPLLCLLRDFAWKYFKRIYYPETYHYVQEIQKYNIQDYRPRMEQFQKAIRKVRQVQRMRKQRGFAFSQVDEGQEKVVRLYDTTQQRGVFGEMKEAGT